jgi:catechol 2,3-dioxygenase-like lactoylglutathione lyase family enzyme
MKISHMMVAVHDQDEALAFYTEKLGFELRQDMPLDKHRWVTVSPPGEDLEIVLIVPEMGPQSPEVAGRIRELMALGALGAGILSVDDCRAAHRELVARGVEFTEEPVERFYGIDAGFRDPSGNPWRLTQIAAVPSAGIGR